MGISHQKVAQSKSDTTDPELRDPCQACKSCRKQADCNSMLVLTFKVPGVACVTYPCCAPEHNGSRSSGDINTRDLERTSNSFLLPLLGYSDMRGKFELKRVIMEIEAGNLEAIAATKECGGHLKLESKIVNGSNVLHSFFTMEMDLCNYDTLSRAELLKLCKQTGLEVDKRAIKLDLQVALRAFEEVLRWQPTSGEDDVDDNEMGDHKQRRRKGTQFRVLNSQESPTQHQQMTRMPQMPRKDQVAVCLPGT
ncbi:hypothetical protein NDU88_003782 [Pleurodeles waltl]|uniref:Uncharacterized protein n=1 Tax=Pleurodeles waltl TaxID=8319 RepID=A0AAV7MER8_PLEWA|nr:hypothetical protein NDU88_003782 [Pleurodeles waltl]